MKKVLAFVAAAVAMYYAAPAAAQDVTTYNGTPNAGWFFGTGNNYSPANTVVDTFVGVNAGDQIFLRWHENGQVAPASVGSIFMFNPGVNLNLDMGLDMASGPLNTSTALLTLVDPSTGQSVAFDWVTLLGDNALHNGAIENSEQPAFPWWFGSNYNPNPPHELDATFSIQDNQGITHTVRAIAQFCDIGAVPEPTTWAMMLLGFGGIGLAMRRKQRQTLMQLA